MARGVTNNYFGLDTDIFELTGADDNPEQQAVSMPDENGDTDAEEVFGIRDKPSNDFAILADVDVQSEIVMGTMIDGGADPDTVLTGFSLNTESGVAPTGSVSGEAVITGSAQGRTVTLPAFNLKRRHKAQVLFAAFTYSGSGVTLTKCSATGSVKLTRSPDAEGKSWDVSGGRVEVQATFKKATGTAITFALAANWVYTQQLKLTQSDKDYETYTVGCALNIDGVDPA